MWVFEFEMRLIKIQSKENLSSFYKTFANFAYTNFSFYIFFVILILIWLLLFIMAPTISISSHGSAKEISWFSRFDNGLLITARAVGIFLSAAFTFTPYFKKQEVDERRGARDRFRLRSSAGSPRCRHCNRCSYKALSGSGPFSHSSCLYLPFSRLVKTFIPASPRHGGVYLIPSYLYISLFSLFFWMSFVSSTLMVTSLETHRDLRNTRVFFLLFTKCGEWKWRYACRNWIFK